MTTTLTVEGMSCEHCEQSVADALGDIDGVTAVRVDREGESATVEGDADASALVAAVDDAGYTAHA
jgi:copper ion binding protein